MVRKQGRSPLALRPWHPGRHYGPFAVRALPVPRLWQPVLPARGPQARGRSGAKPARRRPKSRLAPPPLDWFLDAPGRACPTNVRMTPASDGCLLEPPSGLEPETCRLRISGPCIISNLRALPTIAHRGAKLLVFKDFQAVRVGALARARNASMQGVGTKMGTVISRRPMP